MCFSTLIIKKGKFYVSDVLNIIRYRNRSQIKYIYKIMYINISCFKHFLTDIYICVLNRIKILQYLRDQYQLLVCIVHEL